MSNGKITKDINDIKKELFLKATKSTIQKTNNNLALLYTIIYAWFDKINTIEEFQRRYQSLINQKLIIKESNILELAKKATKTKNEQDIKEAIKVYQSILYNNPEYITLSKIVGYQLPTDFEKKENYLNESLLPKIDFYELFFEELKEINKLLSEKPQRKESRLK